MTNSGILILNFITGIALGIFFSGGLYWTVKKGLTARHPGFLFASSFLIRTALVVGGALLISQGIFNNLVICLIGLILSRSVVFAIEKYTAKNAKIKI